MQASHDGGSSDMIGSRRSLVAFVRRAGVCSLFRKGGTPRLVDFVEGEDPTLRRSRLLHWCEDAHVRGELFLSVDKSGSLVAMAMPRFRDAREAMSHLGLTTDEQKLLGVLRKPMSTPELRKASSLPAGRFDKALIGLRSTAMIALVEVRAESRTKHLNCYARTEQWENAATSARRRWHSHGP